MDIGIRVSGVGLEGAGFLVVLKWVTALFMLIPAPCLSPCVEGCWGVV